MAGQPKNPERILAVLLLGEMRAKHAGGRRASPSGTQPASRLVEVVSWACFHSIRAMRVTMVSNSSSGMSAHTGRMRSAIFRRVASSP